MNTLSSDHSFPEGRDASRDATAMVALQSNADAILVAIPMVGAMFAAFFRLDEFFSRDPKPQRKQRPLSHWDKDGFFVCVEPDGLWENCKGEMRKGLSGDPCGPVPGSNFRRRPPQMNQNGPEDLTI